MATTPIQDIYYPTTATQISPLATQFSTLATSVENALNQGANRFLGTDAQRLALAGVKLREGITFYAQDTNREWRYNGAAWIPNDSGVFAIFPTSVSGGTVQADGSITPTGGGSSVAVNGVFSTNFRKYVVRFDLRFSIASGPYFRLRAAGADYTGSNYNQRGVWQNGASLQTNNGDALSLWSLGGGSALTTFGTVELRNLQGGTNAQKLLLGDIGTSSPIGFHKMSGVLAGVDANTYDGFSITPQFGTFDGTYANSISIQGMP